MARIAVKDIQKGDWINVNTGYRPLDDEWCLVLEVEHNKGLFGDAQAQFTVRLPGGETMHTCGFPLEHKPGCDSMMLAQRGGENPVIAELRSKNAAT